MPHVVAFIVSNNNNTNSNTGKTFQWGLVCLLSLAASVLCLACYMHFLAAFVSIAQQFSCCSCYSRRALCGLNSVNSLASHSLLAIAPSARRAHTSYQSLTQQLTREKSHKSFYIFFGCISRKRAINFINVGCQCFVFRLPTVVVLLIFLVF